MDAQLEIRRALPEDAEALSSIVSEAHRYWGYPPEWINFLGTDFAISAENVGGRAMFVAEKSGQRLGFYVRDGNSLEALWVAPEHFGTGVGKELFLHAKNEVSSPSESGLILPNL
jgi:GNAT superfamily N-acetyltransferase